MCSLPPYWSLEERSYLIRCQRSGIPLSRLGRFRDNCGSPCCYDVAVSVGGELQMSIRKFLRFIFVMALLPLAAGAQGLDATKIDNQLGRSGQKTGDVYKVGFPRTDLHVSVHGLAIKPGLALGSWAAFSGTDDHAVAMGDLVLLEDEGSPGVDKMTSPGFEITPLPNHLADQNPPVRNMNYIGHAPHADA